MASNYPQEQQKEMKTILWEFGLDCSEQIDKDCLRFRYKKYLFGRDMTTYMRTNAERKQMLSNKSYRH